MPEKERWLEPDERLVAFERGFAIYEKLWNIIKCLREQCPSAPDLMMRHVQDTPPEEAWVDHLTWTDRGGEVVQIALSWYRDPWNRGSLDFQLFVKANFTSLGLADVASIATFWGFPYESRGCLPIGLQPDDVFPKQREEIVL